MSTPYWNSCIMLTRSQFPCNHLLIPSSLCHNWPASTFSYGASLAGDDRSISSSSSEASYSDNSLGSRLAIWPEPVRHPTPVEPPPPPSSSSLLEVAGPKSTACSVSTSSDERLYGAMMGGLRPHLILLTIEAFKRRDARAQQTAVLPPEATLHILEASLHTLVVWILGMERLMSLDP